MPPFDGRPGPGLACRSYTDATAAGRPGRERERRRSVWVPALVLTLAAVDPSQLVRRPAARVGSSPARRKEPARSGRRFLPELLGQLADPRRRVAAVPAERLHERQLALLGPAGHGLGRHIQNVGHFCRPQIPGLLRARVALALSCHRASLPESGTDGAAVARTAVGPATTDEDVRRRRSCRSPAGALPTGRLSRPTQATTIARLGWFSASAT